MEFPPEIVRMIRAFSMPCFQYFREYNRAKIVIGDCSEIDWSELKYKMHIDKLVVTKLVSYVNAVAYRKEVRQQLHDHVTQLSEPVDWAERQRLYDLLFDCRDREHRHHRVLLRHIHHKRICGCC